MSNVMFFKKFNELFYAFLFVACEGYELTLCACLKLAPRFRELKRVNTLATLEQCATSEVKRFTIMNESVKRAAARVGVIDLKRTPIVLSNPNVIPHTLQPAHQ
jgi:hypothetical protein